MSVKFPSIPAQVLKSDITSTDASFKLRSIKWYKGSDDVDVDLSASDFGAVGYGCWEPRSSRQEFFEWDTSTIANYATTGITITARGLPWGSDYSTEASTRKFSHPSGSQVLLFTDAPAMWNTMVNKENDETITGKYTFPTGANYPLIGSSYSAPTDDKHIATKKYADDLAIAGAPDASTTVKGIVELATPAENAASTSAGATGARLVPATSDCTSVRSASGYANRVVVTDANGYVSQTFMDNARTWGAVQSFTADNAQITTDADSANDAVRYSKAQDMTLRNEGTGVSGEAITAGNALYVKASDGKLYRTDADADESTYSFVGFAIDAAGAADVTIRFTKPGGIVANQTGLTPGEYLFLSGTFGAVSNAAHATRPARVAQALSATTIRVLEPKFVRSGTQAFSSVTTAVQTVGFYPAYITIRAAHDENGGGGTFYGMSIGDDTNNCIFSPSGVSSISYARAKAWSIADQTPAVRGQGTVSAKSQTGFTLNCDTYSNTGGADQIQWTAYSF